MGVITIIANNFFENASGSIRDDGSSILTQSGKNVIQNGEKGENYDKNKDRKTPTDIRITKVEGPFDGKGRLVDNIVLGTSYSFKATPTRKPTVSEVALLKWSVKLDDGQKEIILGTASVNKLDGDKIIISLRLKKGFEKAKVYAFYQKADDGMSVELSLKKLKFPMLILQSGTRKGFTKEFKPAKDMLFGDYLENEIGFNKFRNEIKAENLSKRLKDKKDDTLPLIKPSDEALNEGADIFANKRLKKLKEYCKKSNKELFDYFANSIDDFALGKLDDVTQEMVKKMQQNQGGEYSNSDLTDAAKNHKSSIDFINGVENYIVDYLRENKGEIEKLEVKDPNSKSEGQILYDIIVDDEKKLKIKKPALGDYFSGLGITINQVWAYQLYISSYQLVGNKYELTLNYIYWDHFGLDAPDLEKHNEGIFYSWFILQHFRSFKPFYTKVAFERKIKGVL